MPLTALQIKQALPRERPYKLFDGGGLFLLVTPQGGKYWRLKYRFNGREKLLAFGTTAKLGLADARKRRESAKDLLAEGVDPSIHYRRNRLAKIQQSENTFESVAREWHHRQSGKWKAAHARQILQCLERDLFPGLGPLAISEIEPPEAIAVIRDIESRGAREVASKAASHMKRIFAYAIQTGRAQHNPASDLSGVLTAQKVKHRPALTRDELPVFLGKLTRFDGSPFASLGLRFLILTFVRSGELRNARWDEINRERAEWRIPADRMKMGIEHLVPLATQSLDLLAELKELGGGSDWVLPGRPRSRKRINENVFLNTMHELGYKGRATPHGFRATASTILNEEQFDPDAIERQLAHVERNAVRAAYHRAEYLEERRRMMQWWADFIERQEVREHAQ